VGSTADEIEQVFQGPYWGCKTSISHSLTAHTFIMLITQKLYLL
jgi:hypothetical protein